MAKHVVDEFVIELRLNDQVTKKLASIEKAASSAAQRIERELGGAFKRVKGADSITRQFKQINDAATRSGRHIKNALTQAFDIGKMSGPAVRQFERDTSQAVKRIKRQLKASVGSGFAGGGIKGTGGAGGGGIHAQTVTIGGMGYMKLWTQTVSIANATIQSMKGAPAGAGQGGAGGGRRGGRNLDDIMSRSHAQNYYGGITRRLTNLGMHTDAGLYQRGLDLIKARYKGASSTEGFYKELGKLNDTMKKTISTKVAEIKAYEKSKYMADSFTSSVKHFVTGFASLYTVMELFNKSLEEGIKRQAAQASAKFVFDRYSKDTGRDENVLANRDAREMADTLGMSFSDTLTQLTKFTASAAPSIGVDKAKDFFKTASVYGKMYGLSADKQEHMMLAFEQMAGKGTVSSEELKGQLAEALPGAEQLFAKALYGDDSEKSVAKLLAAMKKGAVSAAQVLPLVAEQMKKVEEESNSTAVIAAMTATKIGRMKSALEDAAVFFEGGFDGAIGRLAEEVGRLFSGSTELGRTAGEMFGYFINMVSDWLSAFDTFMMKTQINIMSLRLWWINLSDSTKEAMGPFLSVLDNFLKFILAVVALGTALTLVKSTIGTIARLAATLGIADSKAVASALGESGAGVGVGAGAGAGVGAGAVAEGGLMAMLARNPLMKRFIIPYATYKTAEYGFQDVHGIGDLLNQIPFFNSPETQKNNIQALSDLASGASSAGETPSWIKRLLDVGSPVENAHNGVPSLLQAPQQSGINQLLQMAGFNPISALTPAKPVESKLSVDIKVNGVNQGQQSVDLNKNSQQDIAINASLLPPAFGAPPSF